MRHLRSIQLTRVVTTLVVRLNLRLKSQLRIFNLLIIIALLLSACNTATPTSQPTALAPSPVPQSSPVPPASPNPNQAYPLRPTATLYATPQSQSGVFSNLDYGVNVQYGLDWTTQPGDSPDVLTYFYSADGAIIALLLVEPYAANQTLQDAATQLRDSIAGSLSDVKVVSDQSTQIAANLAAWTSLVTAARKDGSRLKFNLTTTTNSGHAYSLLAFGTPSAVDTHQDGINNLIDALSFQPVVRYGLPRDQAMFLAGGESRNPREYDPATTHGSGDKLLYSGLVSFDPQLNVVPELASTWEISDGTTYTFHLRPDARFHNGRPVTAQDVIYSWERAADPKTNSDTVLTYLGDIVGVKEMRDGTLGADHISGLKAIDDHTLQVTIDAAKPYFLLKLTYPTAFVVDKQNIESGPDWYRTPNGTGPYRLIRWDSFKLIIYERNDDFYLEPPQIKYIVEPLFSGVGIRLYESGDVDVAGISLASVPRFQDPKEPMHNELISGVSLCTSYETFDVTQPPFDDPKIRQAFSLAFDRQKYIDVVLHGQSVPAEGIYPPGLPGFNIDLKGLDYDPDRARTLLSESKYGSAANLPPIIYTDGGSGSDIGPGVAAIAQMWQQNLGVTITVQNIEGDKYSDEVHAGRHGQIFGGGWCADYPDPENFADALFHTGAQQNLGKYSNPEVDKLLEQARTEQDANKRMALYQQAEQMIVNDAPALFITHGLSFVVVKPYIKGYVLTPIDVPLERYLSIDPSKLK
jgi:oligopeptide transport system substrate-binding protein